jgi:hypothetical protein
LRDAAGASVPRRQLGRRSAEVLSCIIRAATLLITPLASGASWATHDAMLRLTVTAIVWIGYSP